MYKQCIILLWRSITNIPYSVKLDIILGQRCITNFPNSVLLAINLTQRCITSISQSAVLAIILVQTNLKPTQKCVTANAQSLAPCKFKGFYRIMVQFLVNVLCSINCRGATIQWRSWILIKHQRLNHCFRFICTNQNTRIYINKTSETMNLHMNVDI